jgi:glycerate 2-kinase
MRVLVAPDAFTGTLSAGEAAEAIATGWRRSAPDDQLDLVPLADGGPGFVDVVHAARGGDLLAVTVADPLGAPVPATILRVGQTAYLESAQAVGLALVAPEQRDPRVAATYGMGELLAAAADTGARRIVVGLGGSATNDGGAGMLAALGARPGDGLSAGCLHLAGLTEVDLEPARRRLAGIELVAATDVDIPLLGLRGASNLFGPQKFPDGRADPGQLAALDEALTRWAGLCEPARSPGRTPRRSAETKGAGAAGGLGYGLLLLGATRVSGIETVFDAVDFAGRVAAADLVLTGEGCFDHTSLRGKVVSGVAQRAGHHAKPAVVLAGRVQAGRRELGAAGVASAYAVTEVAGSVRAAMDKPAEHLADLAARVARTWSPRR